MENVMFLFCANYFDRGRPDDDYAGEYDCVVRRGGGALLFDLDAFLARGELDIGTAVRPATVIYRGWMLRCEQYEALYKALRAKGYTLINSPEQYKLCHHLPAWYEQLRRHTAASVWTDGVPDPDALRSLLAQLAGRPLIVKDYVKSRKHEWAEACHIPDASDTARALAVIGTFIERQDTDLVGGIVLRECLPLKITGRHPKSGMPQAREVRVFCLRHTPFASIRYWSGEGEDDGAEYGFLVEFCRRLDSNFHTIDMAQRDDGGWVVMEVGDGQVSGLQDYDAAAFYDGLFALL